MKAAIMTLALSENYGAALQTYALCKAIEKNSVTSVVYKYNDKKRITDSLQGSAKIKHLIWKQLKTVLTLGIKAKKYRIFRSKYIPFTEHYFHNNDELKLDNENYDIYISGSDQIWNPDIFLHDTSYFLDFVPKGKKKISYASSFGKSTFNKSYYKKCAVLLSDFQEISVREESGTNIVKDLCGKEAKVVLDPTFLLDKQEWHELALNASKKAQNFKGILCYVMPGDSKVTDAIESIAQQLHQKTGLPICRIGIKEYDVLKYGYKQTDIFAGPLDFLAYFENAEYIVTNSFHGTAFSLNFQKKFYVVINKFLDDKEALHERVLSILDRLHAKNAIIYTDNTKLPDTYNINYSEIETALNIERKNSYEYLKKALGCNQKKITNPKKCYGCTACYMICPKHAIEMKESKEGFLYPEIDNLKCIDCGLCEKVCPVENNDFVSMWKPKALAVQCKDINIRKRSTSGGAFVALSNSILEQNGVVYGVVYSDDFTVRHIRATNVKNRNQMCGSKYCQSELGETFLLVLKDLNEKKHVLFTGTSCQIDGLKRFLIMKKCDISNLWTCDLVCHGVPSPKIWKEHIKHIEKVRNKKIQSYYNRSKIRGWHAHNECVCYVDGKKEWNTKLSQNYKDLFYGHYIVRESCESCPYAGNVGVADITIGDFWGCEDIMPEIDDNMGTSIVIINSEKGNEIINSCKNEIKYWDVPIELALKYNHNKPIKHNIKRDDFWKDYNTMGFEGVVKKYANDTMLGRSKYYLKKYLRCILVKLKLLHV